MTIDEMSIRQHANKVKYLKEFNELINMEKLAESIYDLQFNNKPFRIYYTPKNSEHGYLRFSRAVEISPGLPNDTESNDIYVDVVVKGWTKENIKNAIENQVMDKILDSKNKLVKAFDDSINELQSMKKKYED